MVRESSSAAECSGLDMGVVGCLGSGGVSFIAVIALVLCVYVLWMKLLCDETWRTEVGSWLYGTNWSNAYSGLLEKLLIRLRWFFGRPGSLRAFVLCFGLAMMYAVAYFFFVAMVGAIQQTTTRWIYAGAIIFLGTLLFRLARILRRRHLRARRRAVQRAHRTGLHLREHLAYASMALAFAGLVPVIVLLALSLPVLVFMVFILPVWIRGDAFDFMALPVVLIFGVTAEAGAEAVAGAVAATGSVAKAGLLALAGVFLFIMPGLNALFDWPSWAASRWLIGRLRSDAAEPDLEHRA